MQARTSRHDATTLIPAVHERWLCMLLVLGKIALAWERAGQMSGSDPGPHLEMVREIRWDNLMMDIHSLFYAYHPPLGFLFAKPFFLMGLTDVQAVQIVSFAASVLAFLLLRATLKHLNLLLRPAGLAFLYVFAAIPIQFYLQTSMNLDVLILCYVTMLLYVSARLFWEPEKRRGWKRATLWAIMGLTLLAGPFTKFSGILLPVIPLAALAVSRERTRIARAWAPLLCAVLVAGALAFPYYHVRYRQSTEHTYFPNNVNWMNGGGQMEAKAARDADPAEFFRTLFLSASITQRNSGKLRIWNAWWDFWVGIFTGPGLSLTVGRIWLIGATCLTPLGLALFALRKKAQRHWRALGWTVLAAGAAFLASFILYLYQSPFAGWGPVKGVYIAPATLGATYLTAQVLQTKRISKFLQTFWGRRLLLSGLCAFMLLNLMVPVYI